MVESKSRSGVLLAMATACVLLLAGCPTVGAVCEPGFKPCGEVCVDLQSDAANCGACGTACGELEVCGEGTCEACPEGGCTYALAGSCGRTAQVVGITEGGVAGAPVQLPASGLQRIGAYEDTILAASYGSEVFQVGRAIVAHSGTIATGASPNAFLSEPPYLFIVNSISNTLQILKDSGAKVPVVEGGFATAEGLQFQPVAELSFGPNTSPQDVVRVRNSLYIPLYGNPFAGAAEAGQKVAEVDVTDVEAPVITRIIDLPGGEALQPYPTLDPTALPSGIVVHRGQLYLSLNNLDTNTWAPGGPGLLAKIALPEGTASIVPLDPEACENVTDVASTGDLLVVACHGATVYTPDYSAVVSVEKSALVLLGAGDAHVATYPFACVTADCPIAQADRLALKGDRVYATDTNGRLVILKASSTGFEEVRGFGATSPKPPSQVCPLIDEGPNNLSDLVVLP